MSDFNKNDLDNYITGHYGEDQQGLDEDSDERLVCVYCGEKYIIEGSNAFSDDLYCSGECEQWGSHRQRYMLDPEDE